MRPHALRAAHERRRRLRIAIISEHASPLGVIGGADGGGQNVYVAHVAGDLARRGHRVDVYTRRDDPGLPEVVSVSPRCRVVHVPAGPPRFVRKEELLPFMPRFAGWMEERWASGTGPYDVVHANFWMSGWVACELKRRFGVPMAVTFHALGRVRRLYQGDADGFPDDRFAIEERIIAEADRVIAQCPQDELDLIGLYGARPSRLARVPCGYAPDECHPVDRAAARRRLGLPADAPVVLQLGRLVPRKGVDDVVRAFARVQRHVVPTAKLVIVGGESDDPDPIRTPEIGRLQAVAAEEGVAASVIFAGRCDRSRLSDHYSAADVFVTMPWYEPFGITPLESMACGTPVIGAQVGGIKHSVLDGETGFLVPPRDVDALAARMALVLRDDALRRRLSANAIGHVRRHYTWSRVVDRMEALLEGVAHGDAELLRLVAGAAAAAASRPVGPVAAPRAGPVAAPRAVAGVAAPRAVAASGTVATASLPLLRPEEGRP